MVMKEIFVRKVEGGYQFGYVDITGKKVMTGEPITALKAILSVDKQIEEWEAIKEWKEKVNKPPEHPKTKESSIKQSPDRCNVLEKMRSEKEKSEERQEKQTLDKDEAFEWFVRGFKYSGEGYNFEYPFCNDDSEFREAMRKEFEEELEKKKFL